MEASWTWEELENKINENIKRGGIEINSISMMQSRKLTQDSELLLGISAKEYSSLGLYHQISYLIKRILSFPDINERGEIEEIYQYINKISEYISEKIGVSLYEKLSAILKEFKIIIQPHQKLELYKTSLDIYFIKYLEDKTQSRPEALKVILEGMEVARNIDLEDWIKTMQLTDEEIEDFRKVTFHGKQKQLSIRILPSFKDSLKEQRDIFNPIIEHLMHVAGITRNDAIKFLASALKFSPSKISTTRIYTKNLLDSLVKMCTTKDGKVNKQKCYTAIHMLLQPIISSFHSEEEHIKLRGYATLDTKTYKLHQRNSINSFINKTI